MVKIMIKNREITLSTKGFCDIINITEKVSDFVSKSKIKDGIVVVFCAHSTAGLTTIEYEEGILTDLKELIEKLVPQDKSYHHDKTWGDGNGFSHLRACLINPSLVVPILDGKLVLGTWQQIVFCDFDNRPRERKVIIQIIGE
jgi:secondary thiamine-phosphate synthase enzyme